MEKYLFANLTEQNNVSTQKVYFLYKEVAIHLGTIIGTKAGFMFKTVPIIPKRIPKKFHVNKFPVPMTGGRSIITFEFDGRSEYIKEFCEHIYEQLIPEDF